MRVVRTGLQAAAEETLTRLPVSHRTSLFKLFEHLGALRSSLGLLLGGDGRLGCLERLAQGRLGGREAAQ